MHNHPNRFQFPNQVEESKPKSPWWNLFIPVYATGMRFVFTSLGYASILPIKSLAYFTRRFSFLDVIKSSLTGSLTLTASLTLISFIYRKYDALNRSNPNVRSNSNIQVIPDRQQRSHLDIAIGSLWFILAPVTTLIGGAYFKLHLPLGPLVLLEWVMGPLCACSAALLISSLIKMVFHIGRGCADCRKKCGKPNDDNPEDEPSEDNQHGLENPRPAHILAPKAIQYDLENPPAPIAVVYESKHNANQKVALAEPVSYPFPLVLRADRQNPLNQQNQLSEEIIPDPELSVSRVITFQHFGITRPRDLESPKNIAEIKEAKRQARRFD